MKTERREEPHEPKDRDKAALTEENVIQVANAVLGRQRRSDRAQRLRQDWRDFIRSEFRLSKTQKEHLDEIPEREVRQIQRAAEEALEAGGAVEIRMPSEGQSGSITITKRQSPDMMAAMIGRVTCTMYADCSGWQCSPGPFG